MLTLMTSDGNTEMTTQLDAEGTVEFVSNVTPTDSRVRGAGRMIDARLARGLIMRAPRTERTD